MITHSYYEEDPRVRREAESLVERGRPVDVFALRRPGDPPAGNLAGVAVRRLDVQRHQGAGLGTYLAEYLAFMARSAGALLRAHRRRHYAIVEVHTLPDFLVLAGLPLRLAGVPLVLDLHEAMPEFFRMRFPRATNPWVHRTLLLQERLSIASASAVITVNQALADRLIAQGVPPGKITVLLNTPSLARFDPEAHPRRAFAEDGVVRLVYAGAVTPTYEVDVVIEAIARLGRRRPELEVTLDVYGRGDSETSLRTLAASRGVADRVTFHGRIPIEDVPAAIAVADIGVAPTRRHEFTDFSLSTKIFEYGAMGKPAVASRLPLVERTFPAGSVWVYEPGDADALATVILGIADDGPARKKAVTRTGELIRALSWDREADRLEALIDRLERRDRD
jgi:glycosyltransferase involved in cell wall biosynthesis